MSTFQLVRPEEGDPILAANMQTPMTNGEAALNALERQAVEPRSLNENNLTTMLIAADITTKSVSADYDIATDYQQAPPGFTTMAGWQRLEWVAGAPPVVTTALDTVASEASTYFGLDFRSTPIDVDGDDIAGILVRWNVYTRKMIDSTGADSKRLFAVFAVQVHTTDGTWTHIPRSIRALINNDGGDDSKTDTPGALFIRTVDIALTNRIVDGIRVVGAAYSSLTAHPTNSVARLRKGQLMAFAVQSGGP